MTNVSKGLTVKQSNGQHLPTVKLPTLEELVQHSEVEVRENNLMVLLNQPPPANWVKQHPMTTLGYLPAERIEYLLSRIFLKWWLEVKSVSVLANSVCVVVRLFVINPITKETDWQDGVGAVAIQTDKGKGAMDWNFAKSDGVMKAAPAAETYAFKDAAEKFGKLFGKDLARKEAIGYTELLKENQAISFEDLRELYELKKDSLSNEDVKDAERILNNNEVRSYKKLQTLLMSK